MTEPTTPAAEPGDRPARGSAVSKIVLGVVVAAITGLIVYAVSSDDRGTIDVGEGDCIKIVSAADAQIDRVDCGSTDAVYKVAKKLDSATGLCPAGEYTQLTSGSSMKLCLMLNAKEGDCLRTETVGRNRTHERVPCGPSAEYRIVKVLPGTVDTKACEPGNVVATYLEPPTTICLTTKP
ncbi:hypothetical protein [Actinocrispum sp. NPDC049592]|uniref:LppU/SCO3897 family protein n=1 Tax=Actinocrispum sp. NPDC049592 TaxID=3154835 RepID=UPI003414C683